MPGYITAWSNLTLTDRYNISFMTTIFFFALVVVLRVTTNNMTTSDVFGIETMSCGVKFLPNITTLGPPSTLPTPEMTDPKVCPCPFRDSKADWRILQHAERNEHEHYITQAGYLTIENIALPALTFTNTSTLLTSTNSLCYAWVQRTNIRVQRSMPTILFMLLLSAFQVTVACSAGYIILRALCIFAFK